MTQSRVAAAAVAAVLLLPLSADAQSRADEQVLDRFVGMWRLVSWTVEMPDGTTRPDPRSEAFLAYTDEGYMCSVGVDPERSEWRVGTDPTATEALETMGPNAMYAYCARVEIDAEEQYVLHHVEVDRSPNLMGAVRKRFYTFVGDDRLELRLDPAGVPAPAVGMTLLWERVAD